MTQYFVCSVPAKIYRIYWNSAVNSKYEVTGIAEHVSYFQKHGRRAQNKDGNRPEMLLIL